MNIHEYQAKQLFRDYGVDVPFGIPAFSVDDAIKASKSISTEIKVVKAQIHAGGRGKAGGVKIAKNAADVEKYSNELIGKILVTHQTGPSGKEVKRLLIEEGCNIDKEFYLSLILDRSISKIIVMVSSEGGMDIEEVADKNPEKIIKEVVEPAIGLQQFQARKIAFKLGLKDKLVFKFVNLLLNLYKLFIEKDCSIVEVNPLVTTTEGNLVALDAKINFDANALYRHQDILNLRDLDEEDSKEVEASKFDLSYISLDGNIGCMVNGAGLAMSTMDIIKLYGGNPANFLDVGGSASSEKVTEAFKIILSDSNVKGIFVNIFGGIMKCDVIAEGIVTATKQVGLTLPLVVRLEGTNVQKGKEILNSSGLNIISASNLSDGAEKIVNLVNSIGGEN
ncbi:MAG: succinate--CoA ligase subunit beta [Bacillales bacterium]|jgi:succinyl-CoA synthetase beta subunit|nr:succinate--CoA ligase subunit beta [Bacillales bacterium]